MCERQRAPRSCWETSATPVPRINDAHTDPDPGHQWIEEDFDNGLAGIGILTGVNHVQIPRKRGVIRNDSGGLLARRVEALFRRKLRDFLVTPIDVEQGIFSVVVRVRVLRVALAFQPVGTDIETSLEPELLFLALVEGRTGDSDEYDDDAKMNDVPTIAAGVATA